MFRFFSLVSIFSFYFLFSVQVESQSNTFNLSYFQGLYPDTSVTVGGNSLDLPVPDANIKVLNIVSSDETMLSVVRNTLVGKAKGEAYVQIFYKTPQSGFGVHVFRVVIKEIAS